VAKGHTLSAGWSSKVTEISPSGYNRGDEDNPKSCNRSPPVTSSSSNDNRGGGIGRDLHTNMQPAVEAQFTTLGHTKKSQDMEHKPI